MIGKTIAHYKVTAELGKGGMGEVWRAQDTKLGRDVALKVLPDSFAQDPERLERFEREARVLASLSHSNIAGIHGLEDVDGRRFLVMEVAEGETLSDRIARGPIAVADAARIARQIAEALEIAHEKGIVHRDLKPGNVMVKEDGSVKVLDFGLAKAMGVHPLSGGSGQDWTQSPTLAPGGTQAGMLLGTAGYMSPEQARGKPVDRRADIWAFGCVLFEMLGGRKAFDGETVTDVLGAIVHKEPEVDKLPTDVPRKIRGLIQRCLQKDQSRRLQSIGDARIALEEWIENPEAGGAGAEAGRRWVPWAAAAVAGLLGLVAGAVLLRPSASESPRPVLRASIPLATSLFSSSGSNVEISPDGRLLVYVARDANNVPEIVLRPLDRVETNTLVSGAAHPFFSPDGEWLGFADLSSIKKMPIQGGTAITLAEANRSRGATWGEDGTVVFAPRRGGLMRVSASGGEPQPLTTLDEERNEISHRWPRWLPGGRAVLFTTIRRGDVADEVATIELVEVATGERNVLHQGGSDARYVSTGHLLFVDGSTLFALPFDLDQLEPTGSHMPVLEGLAASNSFAGHLGLSQTGLLAYVGGALEAEPYRLMRVDRDGRSEVLWDEPGFHAGPRFSPDGRRLAVTVFQDGNFDVWVYDLDRKVSTRITHSPGYDADQVWTPDGRYLIFASNRESDQEFSVYRKRADGAGEAELLVRCEAGCWPLSTSADGHLLALSVLSREGGSNDIQIARLDGSGEPEPYLATDYQETDPAFSPDGRWIAYRSNESGASRVYVQSYPAGGNKFIVSNEAGGSPVWSPDGSELFYRTPNGLMVVPMKRSGDRLQPGIATELLVGSFAGGIGGVSFPGGWVFPDYAVAPDGRSFVMLQREQEASMDSIEIVSNWFGGLGRLTRSSRVGEGESR